MRNNSAHTQGGTEKTRLTVGVPDCRFELHFRGTVGEVGRKVKLGREEASFVQSLRRSHDDQVPLEYVRVVAQTHRDPFGRIAGQLCVRGDRERGRKVRHEEEGEA